MKMIFLMASLENFISWENKINHCEICLFLVINLLYLCKSLFSISEWLQNWALCKHGNYRPNLPFPIALWPATCSCPRRAPPWQWPKLREEASQIHNFTHTFSFASEISWSPCQNLGGWLGRPLELHFGWHLEKRCNSRQHGSHGNDLVAQDGLLFDSRAWAQLTKEDIATLKEFRCVVMEENPYQVDNNA